MLTLLAMTNAATALLLLYLIFRKRRLRDASTTRFGDEVALRFVHERECPSLGAWYEDSGQILIRSGEPEAGKYILLIHETMHMAESMLKQAGVIQRRVTHSYIENAAPIILAFLVDVGAITNIRPADVTRFLEEHGVDPMAEAGHDGRKETTNE